MPDLPLIVAAALAWLYWARVGSMVVRARRRSRDLSGLVPEQSGERLMWLLWVPVVVAWIALPTIALARGAPPLGVPPFARAEPLYEALRWIAAAIGVAAFVATLRCQARMGRNWRMDVSEKHKGDLVTDGLYARIRHPIYALQVLLMICTAVVLPTAPMIAVAAIHAALVAAKARNEERFLLSQHGPSYADYQKRTGRFVPRLRAR